MKVAPSRMKNEATIRLRMKVNNGGSILPCPLRECCARHPARHREHTAGTASTGRKLGGRHHIRDCEVVPPAGSYYVVTDSGRSPYWNQLSFHSQKFQNTDGDTGMELTLVTLFAS